MEHTTKRHSLNKNQIHLLKLIYKFRFATSLLIARYKEAGSIRSTNTSLTTLVESGHLARRFTSEYNLLHKPAEYFLTTKAIKLLSTKEPSLNRLSLSRMRANNSVGDLFIKRQLLAFEAYIQLEKLFGFKAGDYQIYTRAELAGLSHLPEPSPDLYIRRASTNPLQSPDYFLTIFGDTQPFIIKKTIESYLKSFLSSDWQEKEGRDYPTVMISCPSSSTKEKFLKYCSKLLYDAYVNGLTILVTTNTELLNPSITKFAIWSNSADTADLITISNHTPS